MNTQKILSLVVLALLVAACFLSDNLARMFVSEDEKKQEKLSLLIKLGVLAVAVVLFFVFFI